MAQQLGKKNLAVGGARVDLWAAAAAKHIDADKSTCLPLIYYNIDHIMGGRNQI